MDSYSALSSAVQEFNLASEKDLMVKNVMGTWKIHCTVDQKGDIFVQHDNQYAIDDPNPMNPKTYAVVPMRTTFVFPRSGGEPKAFITLSIPEDREKRRRDVV